MAYGSSIVTMTKLRYSILSWKRIPASPSLGERSLSELATYYSTTIILMETIMETIMARGWQYQQYCWFYFSNGHVPTSSKNALHIIKLLWEGEGRHDEI